MRYKWPLRTVSAPRWSPTVHNNIAQGHIAHIGITFGHSIRHACWDHQGILCNFSSCLFTKIDYFIQKDVCQRSAISPGKLSRVVSPSFTFVGSVTIGNHRHPQVITGWPARGQMVEVPTHCGVV